MYGSFELTILPYNFPVLFPLIKSANDYVLSGNMNTSNSMIWLTSWRRELTNCLHPCPQYCRLSIVQLLNRINLSRVVGGSISVDAKLHKNPYREISLAKARASQDLNDIDRIAEESREAPLPDIAAIACEKVLDYRFPKSVFEVESHQLLQTWERMRRAIFGASGMTVQGLSVNGIETNGKHFDNANNSGKNHWMYKAVGAANVGDISIKEMSDYLPILARREALRDPLILDPPLDEDTPAGILKRKLDVNFGSRFNKKKSNISNGVEIEGIAGILTSNELATIPTEHNDDAPLSDGWTKRFSNTHNRTYWYNTNSGKRSWDIPLEIKPASSPSSSPSPVVPTMETLTTNDSAKKEAQLPQGWVQLFSSRQNRVYWYNSTTGMSSWEYPSDDHSSLKSNEVDKIIAEASSKFGDTPNPYRESESIEVMGMSASAASLVEKKSTDPIMDESTPKLPSGWIECFSTRQNRKYWYNSVSKESSWEFPTS